MRYNNTLNCSTTPMQVSGTAKVLLVYPILLLLAVPLRFLINELVPGIDPKRTPLLRSNSWFNTYFAGSAYQIFITIYLTIHIFTIYVIHKTTPILPTPTTQPQTSLGKLNVRTRITTLLLIYTPVVILIQWFFGGSLFDRLNSATGGHCTLRGDYYYRACIIAGGTYVNGFKASGHSLITTVFGTSAAFEIHRLNVFVSTTRVSRKISVVAQFITCVTVMVCAAWLLLFSITCLFYHTFVERLTGTVLGVCVVYVTYMIR